nr:uncharacterized protein LOC122173973 [Chrysemys picta bellii]
MDPNQKSFTKHTALWSQEHRQISVSLWSEASKTTDFSPSTRNDQSYPQRAKKLMRLEIYRTGDQCREWSKWLKTKYLKTRNHSCTSGSSRTPCLFCDEFDQVLGTASSTKATGGAGSPGQDGALRAPEASTEIDGSQQRAPNEANEVTLLMKRIPEEALSQEQVQHILGPSSVELFHAPPRGTARYGTGRTNGRKRETSREPGPLTSPGGNISAARPHAEAWLTGPSRSVPSGSFSGINLWLEFWTGPTSRSSTKGEGTWARGKTCQERQAERLGLASQLEDRGMTQKQALASQFLEQEWRLKEEDRGLQRELFERLLSLMASRLPAAAAPWAASPPWYPALHSRSSLDNSMAGWPVQ